MNRWIVMCSLLLVVSHSYASSYKVQEAEQDARSFEIATRLVSKDIGRLLVESEWPGALVEAPPGTYGWKGPYMDPAAVRGRDPWGNEYHFKIQPTQPVSFGIYSSGQDGIDNRGAGDDVSSWAGYKTAIYFPGAARNKMLVLAVLGVFFGAIAYGLVRFASSTRMKSNKRLQPRETHALAHRR